MLCCPLLLRFRGAEIQVDPSTDPGSHALLAIIRQTPWYRDPSGSKWIQARIQAAMLCWLSFGRLRGIGIQVDPSGSKHGSKLPCCAGYHSVDSIVSGSTWIQVDPSTDPSSHALLAIIRQTPWYQDPSGSKLGSKHSNGKHNDILTKTNPHTDLIIILLKEWVTRLG